LDPPTARLRSHTGGERGEGRLAPTALALAALVGALAALLAFGPHTPGAGASSWGSDERSRGHPEIRVLSTRPELVSGGDALVEVSLPRRVSGKGLRIRLNGVDVTKSFRALRGRRYVALLTSLSNGENRVTAQTRGGRGARLTIRNHPIGGPVLAGPQIQPWRCSPGATDAQCNRSVRYDFFYKSTTGGPLRAYDPSNPPSDVASATTDQGKQVPFIVRQETGVLDRDEYRIAVLFDPNRRWSAVKPQEGFNHKLVIFHGASCDTGYGQATAPDVLNETVLGQGFATMSHALDNAGHNCNLVTQAESLIMTKERLVDHYGTLRYTIGSGCSGGSLVQQQVANAYPGVYQGLTPACSFPDAWSTAMQYVDYQLLLRYLRNPAGWAPGVTWPPDAVAAIEGHPNPANAINFTTLIPSSGEPTRSCPGVPPDQVFDENTNPRGVRCTLQDYMVNVFGRRPQDGFAGRPVGNVGLQYGLRALKSGRISPAQFVDLNAKIGGFDVNYNHTAARSEADRSALARVYRSGAVNTAEHLDKVAIIDFRGPDEGFFHDVYRTYVMRARLEREHGTAANQLIWRGPIPLSGDRTFSDSSILAMDEWLAAVEKDRRSVPLARKIIEDRPSSVRDRCTDGNGTDVPAARCDAVVRAYSDPEIEAGMPLTHDTMACQLKPLRRSDYRSVVFTDAQWAQLRSIFPRGVCDFSKPGLDRVRTEPWQTYQDAEGAVIYGGQPLGPVPRAKAFRARWK
jgi:hypothetical protein